MGIILMIMFSILTLGIFNRANIILYLYLGLYLLLLFCAFFVSEHWLSTLTLFSVFYTIFASGYIFVWIEKVQLLYNPFYVVIVPYFCLIVGYCVAHNIKIQKNNRLKKKRMLFSAIQLSRKELLIATFALSSLAFLLYFLKNHSILLVGNLNDSRIDAMSGNGMLLYIMELNEITVPLLYAEKNKKNISGFLFWIVAIVSGLELLITGFRAPVMTMIMTTMIVAIYQGRIRLRKVVMVVPMILILAIIYGAIRNGVERGIYAILKNFCYTGMYNLNIMFRAFPDKHPFQHGYTYLINLIMLKPGPDLDFTLWLKEMVGFSFSGGGITPTIIGEFYINFGYLGIYLGMALLGIVFRQCDKWVIKGNYNAWSAFIMLELSCCNGGGIANIYILPLVAWIYFSVLKIFENRRREGI